ncbi:MULTISPECIES: Bug family tripartite tricarboxylate transporter substrate binding protein [Cupriavidus]
MTRRAFCLALAAAAMTLGAQAPARAQTEKPYPGRPVTIVVGFSAGGSTDILARLLAKELSTQLDGNFIVDNKPGANSNIANAYVGRASPDGYTLLMVPFGLPVNPYLYKNPGYRFPDQFAPIALVAKVPNVIAVKADSPIRNVADYVARSKNGGITYSTPGMGSSLHLAGELFRYETRANLLHVPYKGSAPALVAIIGGEVESGFDNLSAVAPYVKEGKLRALAVTSKVRSPEFPNVPTVAESGFPQYEISSYFGLAAPAGTSPRIVATLNAAVMKALQSPDIKAALNNLGALTEQNSPEDFRRFLLAENRKWGVVIRDAKIEPN